MKNKKFICLLLLFSLIASMLIGCTNPGSGDETSADASTSEQIKYETFEIQVHEFNKRGNVILETDFDKLKSKNIEPADIISVKIGDKSYDIPVGTSYSDVDSGDMLCRFDTEDSKVVLAINGGSFAEKTEMAVKETITEDPGYKWNVKYNSVYFTLKEKGGYADEYTIRNLVRTDERTDYSSLSDADYANCRAISTSGIKANTVYRGTTPIDTDIARDTYAMAFIREKGIKSVLNLADSPAEMTAFATYANSYYASCKIWNAEMDYTFTSETFRSKVKDCIIFMIENDGPFYIHCKEGKDRTGILCAILEFYFGASLEEVKNDYMLTYSNFYHVEKGSDTYNTILKSNLEKTLSAMLESDKLEGTDLKSAAEKYLLSCGLSSENLASLKAKIGA